MARTRGRPLDRTAPGRAGQQTDCTAPGGQGRQANRTGWDVPPTSLASGMRKAAREIGVVVARAVVEDGVAPEATEAEMRGAVAATQWRPRYA